MPIQTLTLAEVRDMIKVESRVKGADNLNVFVDQIINELLLSETYNRRYHQLLVVNHPITLLNATSQYGLPDDFQEMRLVRYTTAGGYTRTLAPRSEYVEPSVEGGPKYYELSGEDAINIFPFSTVVAADTFLLDYYKYPAKLAADDDIFPVPKLLAVIKQKAISRVHTFNKDYQAAQISQGSGEQDANRAQSTADNEAAGT